jgi:hypothetical protein
MTAIGDEYSCWRKRWSNGGSNELVQRKEGIGSEEGCTTSDDCYNTDRYRREGSPPRERRQGIGFAEENTIRRTQIQDGYPHSSVFARSRVIPVRASATAVSTGIPYAREL